MKSFSEIYSGIKEKFFSLSGHRVEENTAIDSYIVSSSQAIEEAHKEIEANKTPHIYTGLNGHDMDKLGYLAECFRENDESDDSYLYRIMTSRRRGESSNETAINSSLVNLKYSSDATYVPLTNGCGTGTVYIIPKDYEEASQEKAIEEVHERLSSIICKSSYVEYVIPEPISVSFIFYISSRSGDLELIKRTIEQNIRSIVNGIAPGNYLSIGEINKIGTAEQYVDYFQVSEVAINGVATSDKLILQKRDTKMILDKITWWVSEV